MRTVRLSTASTNGAITARPSAWPNHQVWKVIRNGAPRARYRPVPAISAPAIGATTATQEMNRQAPSTVARFSVGANRRASRTATTISAILATPNINPRAGVLPARNWPARMPNIISAPKLRS